MVNSGMVEPAAEPTMVEPAAHRFTVDEYYRMAETGILQPEARVELLDGEVIDMMPIDPPHGGTVNKLNHLFLNSSQGRWVVSVQNPVRLSPRSEPQPDLMLLKPDPEYYAHGHPEPEDVFLLVEVADTTVSYDRNRKIPAYGRAGIPEVWLINLPKRTVEVFRNPHATGYASIQTFGIDDTLEVPAFPDVRIKVGALLKHAN
jgi:Uma2 family endonuclease